MDKPKLKASEILKLQDNVKKLEKLKKSLRYLQEGKLRTFGVKLYVKDFEFSVDRSLKSPDPVETQILESYLSAMVAHYESIIPFEIELEEEKLKASPKRAVKRSFDDDEDSEEDLEEDDEDDEGDDETESVYRL